MFYEDMIKLELVTEAIQFTILLVLMYHSFAKARIDGQQRLFFFAFASYGFFLILHAYTRALHVGFLNLGYYDISALFAQLFKTMFFMLFGYAILDALIRDATLKRILKSNAVAAFLILFLISIGIVLIEGRALLFSDTAKALIYESLEITIQVMIINIAYHSWRDTGSKNLLMVGGAFILFLAADVAHIYRILWGFSLIEYMVRHTLRLFALALLAYALIFYNKSKP